MYWSSAHRFHYIRTYGTAMTVSSISQTPRVLPGKQSCEKLKILTVKCMKIKIINFNVYFFGKWPWYLRDNALRGVQLSRVNGRCGGNHATRS